MASPKDLYQWQRMQQRLSRKEPDIPLSECSQSSTGYTRPSPESSLPWSEHYESDRLITQNECYMDITEVNQRLRMKKDKCAALHEMIDMAHGRLEPVFKGKSKDKADYEAWNNYNRSIQLHVAGLNTRLQEVLAEIGTIRSELYRLVCYRRLPLLILLKSAGPRSEASFSSI